LRRRLENGFEKWSLDGRFMRVGLQALAIDENAGRLAQVYRLSKDKKMRLLKQFLAMGPIALMAACQTASELPPVERSDLPEKVWRAIEGQDIDPRTVIRGEDDCYYEAFAADFEVGFHAIFDASDKPVCDKPGSDDLNGEAQ
jgi:hypothetical protein